MYSTNFHHHSIYQKSDAFGKVKTKTNKVRGKKEDDDDEETNDNDNNIFNQRRK